MKKQEKQLSPTGQNQLAPSWDGLIPIRKTHEADIQKAITYGCMLVGLKPEPLEITIVSKFVKDNFKNLTIKNVIKAFEINSSGKYWETIEPYGVLDTIFIGKILRNYTEEKRKYLVRQKQKANQKRLAEGKPATNETAKKYLDLIRAEIITHNKPQEQQPESKEINRNTLKQDVEDYAKILPDMSKGDLKNLLHNCKKSVTFGLDGTRYNPYNELINKIENEMKKR